jgi:dTMP kinase
MYFEIEGIDGAGKSTQCRLLKDHFDFLGLDSVIIKELDSTEFSKHIREILITDIMKDARTEMFLFLSCKCQVFSQLIRPSLSSGKIIIGDRGSGSFISYNASILEMDTDILKNLIRLCSLGSEPDLIILLDIPVEVAQKRIAKKDKTTRFDLVDANILAKQREKFLEVAKVSPNWLTIDGTVPIENISALIKHHAMKLMGKI